jgi:hypothetical protein
LRAALTALRVESSAMCGNRAIGRSKDDCKAFTGALTLR